jgi:hypothetical protein
MTELLPKLAVGDEALSFIRTNYRARRPAMLIGRHGVGKSELFEQAAQALGVACIVFDLSLCDAVDLTGLPDKADGRTVYLPPARLPTGGNGLLVFEELNRAAEATRTPCLQLCTARRLNDYALPPGWVPMAAANPREGGYQVDDLCPALLSRFNRAEVVADRRRWVEWAGRSGVDPRVVGFVDMNPKVFDGGLSNPRAWKYVSDVLTAWEGDRDGELQPKVAGLVGETWAVAFLRHLQGNEKSLSGPQVVGMYQANRKVIQDQVRTGRLDAVQVTIQKVKEHLLVAGPAKLGDAAAKNVGQFLDDLPGDLKIDLRGWLAQNGHRRLLKGE